jgi:glycosyltransferase involved in cell wall biosynthesis
MTTYTVHPEATVVAASHLQGKRAAMVTFSSYPADPRPRRAADGLLKEGMSVDLICLAHENGAKHETIGSLHVARIPINHKRGGKFTYGYNYSAFLTIAMSLLAMRGIRRKYDLVYVHNMPDVLVLSALVPKVLGAKVILDMHDPMPELMTTIFGLARESRSVRTMLRLERWSMAFADAVITVNIACKRMFSSRSCPSEKVSVVMNSPDGQIFPLRAPHPHSYGSKTHDNRFVMMYHGSLVERNGLDLAVDALAQVRETIPGIELRIYGRKTPFLTQTLEAAQRKGLQDCVHYFGPKTLEGLVEAIDECDVGVIPNHRSAFTDINTPTRIFEYLALGKPVIAPSTAGIEDYFTPESLFFFEAGNSQELAQRIEQVAFDPNEAFETAVRGQQVYKEHTWTQERNTLVGVVNDLLKVETHS